MSAQVEGLDCSATPRHKDVLAELKRIHAQMHAGKPYGFEQSLLCDLIREIERLRDENRHLRAEVYE